MRSLLFFVLVMLLPWAGFAQSEATPDSSSELEQILSSESKTTPEDEAPEKPQAPAEKITPKELSDLGRLAPFSDIAMIQRKFLPKTGRFEFNPNVGAVLNDVFYQNTQLGGKLGYYFTEQYGVELSAIGFSRSDRKAVKDLKKGRVDTEGFIAPYSYYGLDFKWSPVYGKMGFMADTVVPFDMYFSLGGGVTNTSQKTSPSTVHLGMGQIFASRKWLAFRWDMGFYWYSSKYKLSDNTEGSGSFMNLNLNLGVSFFFPEAKYR